MDKKYKTDLVAAVTKELQLDDPELVKHIIDGVARVMVDWLSAGSRVTWTGFGVFDPRERISPKPGQPFADPVAQRGPTRWVLFRPSAYLRELLREGAEENE